MMARRMFETILRDYLHRQPFQPFLIEADDGRQWEIRRPELLSYYVGDSALYVGPDESMDIIDADNVKRFVELTPVVGS